MSFRLAVDLRPLLDPHESGVTIYTKEMVRALLKDPNLELDLFYQAKNSCARIHDVFPGARHLPISNTAFHLRCLLGFPNLPKGYFHKTPDLIWIPDRRPFYRSNIPLVMTIHDKVPERFSHTLSFKSRIWHKIFPLEKLLSLCSGVLAPSSTTAVELPSTVPTEVTYEGASLAEPIAPKGAKKLLSQDFFLFIGPADPRKHLDWLQLLIEAYPKVHFAWIGFKKRDRRFRKWNNQPMKNLFVYEQVSENEKIWFLKKTKGLLAISSYEGFDLPVLEAVRAKCPVLLSDIAVHHELYKVKGGMVKSIEDLHANFQKLLQGKGEIPIPRGKYSWDSAAKRALLFFRRVVLHKY